MTAHARKTPGSNVASPKTAGAASFILNVDTPAGTIAVTVTRKRVRNLNLRVRGDGSVVASIPLHTSAARAQAFLDRARAAGATMLAPPYTRPWGMWSGFFQDPDGHLWEIAFNPGFAAES